MSSLMHTRGPAHLGPRAKNNIKIAVCRVSEELSHAASLHWFSTEAPRERLESVRVVLPDIPLGWTCRPWRPPSDSGLRDAYSTLATSGSQEVRIPCYSRRCISLAMN